MRIAVTGASGFVGRALVSVLAARGHAVRPLGREVLGDIARFSDWAYAVTDSDAIVHLAALAHRRGVSETRLQEVNVNASVALGKAAAKAGRRVLFISTVKVLGEETARTPFDARSDIAPGDGYGRAKAHAEDSLRAIEGLKLTILRPPLVYGPGVKGNFLALLRAIDRGLPLPFASVPNRRSVIYVGNLADAIASCLELRASIGRTYSVTDGVSVSTPQLCRAMGDALGCPARLLPFPPAALDWIPSLRRLTRSLEVDDSAIRSELGWRPPYSFEQGLRATAEWYLAQGS